MLIKIIKKLALISCSFIIVTVLLLVYGLFSWADPVYTVTNVTKEGVTILEKELGLPLSLHTKVISLVWYDHFQDNSAEVVFEVEAGYTKDLLLAVNKQYTKQDTLGSESEETFTLSGITYTPEFVYESNSRMYTSLCQYNEVNGVILYSLTYRYPGEIANYAMKNADKKTYS